MRIPVLLLFGVSICRPGGGAGAESDEAWLSLGRAPNPEAVQRALAGELDTVSAAWWGFDPEDSTDFLQGAVDSGAKTVIVPFMGRPWTVRPIRLRSHLTVRFEPGVAVEAKRGEFHGKGDSLFRAENVSDLVLRGYGARLSMWKEDYQSDAYAKAEWRMGVNLRGCTGVRIEGLSIEKTGGDGVYIGSTDQQPFCKDVVIRDTDCVANHRQGISVISAENLLIEKCLLADTDGTAPQAGIDFEPNGAEERLVNCVVRNCRIENNTGPGVLIYLNSLADREKPPEPVSIRFENCLIRGGAGGGIQVMNAIDAGPAGFIEFRSCTVEDTAASGIAVIAKSADRARVRFLGCSLQGVAGSDDHPWPPILIGLRKPEFIARDGGIDLVGCSVFDARDRPVIGVENGTGRTLYDIHGEIAVHNPHGVKAPEWVASLDGVDLEVTALPWPGKTSP